MRSQFINKLFPSTFVDGIQSARTNTGPRRRGPTEARKEFLLRKYEMTYLISDLVREGDLNKVTGKVAKYIADLGGKTVKEDIWGRRKLAYPIKKQEFATYVTLYFSLDALKMKEFDRDIRLESGIIRHLTVVKEFGEETLTLLAKEIAGTEDIKDVIGGEKSFEAVEGETEESKDLMAQREVVKNTGTEAEELRSREAEKEAGTEAEEQSGREAEIEKPKKATVKKEKAAPKEEKKESNEAERLSKLNDELDDILKDQL